MTLSVSFVIAVEAAVNVLYHAPFSELSGDYIDNMSKLIKLASLTERGCNQRNTE